MDSDIVQIAEKCGPELKATDCSIKIVGALYLFREDDKSLLLQLRDVKPNLRHAGLWVPPGGHSESDETVEECTRREFYEETNYFCEQMNWVSGLEIKNPQWPTFLLGISWAYYDEIQPIKCREGQALKFVNRHEAKSLPIPTFVYYVWDMITKNYNFKTK